MNKVTNVEIVSALKKEAETNKAFNAVCHVFAIRKRTRFTLTVGSMAQAMRRERFQFGDQEYVSIIKFLAGLGLGNIETNRTGKVKGLSGLKVTLQSIGKAACSTEMTLTTARPKHKFEALIVPTPEAIKSSDIGLTIYLNDKPVNFSLPSNLKNEEVLELLGKLRKV